MKKAIAKQELTMTEVLSLWFAVKSVFIIVYSFGGWDEDLDGIMVFVWFGIYFLLLLIYWVLKNIIIHNYIKAQEKNQDS